MCSATGYPPLWRQLLGPNRCQCHGTAHALFRPPGRGGAPDLAPAVREHDCRAGRYLLPRSSCARAGGIMLTFGFPGGEARDRLVGPRMEVGS